MPEEKKSQLDLSNFANNLKGAALNFIIPLIAIVLTALLGIFYIKPSIKELPEKKEELQNKIMIRDILSKKVSNLNKLRDYQAILDENLEIVNKVLVPEPEAPRLLDQASQMAGKAGMSLEKLSYSYSSKGKTGGSFDMVNISMGVKSSFEQFVLFMEIVENAARYVSIPDFRYSISDKDTEDGDLSSNFSVNSPYLFVQSAAVTDDPVSLDITSPEFISFMEMLKGLDYYDFINPNIEVVEEAPEEEAVSEEDSAEVTEQPENESAEVVTEPIEATSLENTEEATTEENNSIFLTQ